MVVEDSKKYLDPIEATDGIELKDVEAPWQSALDGEATLDSSPLKVHGSAEEKQISMALNAEFSDVFSVAVQKEPARVDPYEIDVDLEKWNSSRVNRGAARPVSQAMQEVVRDQTGSLLELSVLKTSEAERHSQILMIKKPGTNPP